MKSRSQRDATAAEEATARALNGAIAAARRHAVATITARYAASESDVEGMLSVSRASATKLDVKIVARSRALSVGYFPHAPQSPGSGGRGKPSLRAEIRRGAPKEIEGAFVARLNSGLRVMRRTGGKTSTGKDKIASVYTIPLAEMMGVASVRAAIEEHALATLDQRLDREIDARLKELP
jgi:hypothetical protein